MIHCFYHSADLDGHCSGAIVKYRFPDAVMHPINYGDPFPWDEIKEDDEVYMVDFALQPPVEMEKLIKSYSRKLVWIDHHKSAIDSYEPLASAYGINGICLIGKAACELTWEYLFPDKPVPLAVKLLSLYDSWQFHGHELEDMVLPFQMRMRMEELDPRNWEIKVSYYGDTVGDTWEAIFNTTLSNPYLPDLINEGRLLLRYDKANKAKYARTYAFETHLPASPIEEAPHYGGASRVLSAIAVNLGHTNSKVFDSVWRRECPKCGGSGNDYEDGELVGLCLKCDGDGYLEPYDLMITFVRRTDKLWNVSLYSTKEYVDCGAIAKSFGGGGHKGAAGFQCKELPFEY